MAEWIFPYNDKYYRVGEALQALGSVDWHQDKVATHAAEGDIVYLYASAPKSRITHRCVVVKARKTSTTIDDSAFYTGKRTLAEPGSLFLELRLQKEFPANNGMHIFELRAHGLRYIMGQIKAPEELSEYLHSIDEVPNDTAEELLPAEEKLPEMPASQPLENRPFPLQNEIFAALREELAKLHARQELSQTVGPDYFEPGMMEYLDQSDGFLDSVSNEVCLRFEAKGTRYEGRTARLEHVSAGDPICIERDPENTFNPNNFRLLTAKKANVGNMPASLCNALAPLYDEDTVRITSAKASFVEPISKRSRHARQAILFVEMRLAVDSSKLPIPEETPEKTQESSEPESKAVPDSPLPLPSVPSYQQKYISSLERLTSLGKPVTRGDLAEDLHTPRAAVTVAVRDLIKSGIVLEDENGALTLAGARSAPERLEPLPETEDKGKTPVTVQEEEKNNLVPAEEYALPVPDSEDGPFAFISYSHSNPEEAMRIISLMQSMGYRVWFDSGIESGRAWGASVAEHLDNCSVFVLLITESYFESAYCQDELYMAKSSGKQLLPIDLEGVSLSPEYRLMLGRFQAIRMKDLTDRMLADKLSKIQALKKILKN